MPKCKLCSARDVDNRTLEMCLDCMRRIGVMELPPPIRPAAPCLRCGCMRFIRVVPREYTVFADLKANVPQVAPMTLTQVPEVVRRALRGDNSVTARVDDGRGIIETYVCMECSFVEWYCQDAHHIPIGPQYMSEIVDYGSDSAK